MRTILKADTRVYLGKLLLAASAAFVLLPYAADAHSHKGKEPSITKITPASYEFGIPHPASGSYEAQVKLTINGAGFQKGARALFNGKRVPTTYISESEIDAEVPGDWVRKVPDKLITPNVPADGIQGNAKIQVRNPAHGGTSRPFLFPITATPIE